MREKKRIYFILEERGAKNGGMVNQCNAINTYLIVENVVLFAFGWSFVGYFTSRSM